MYALFRAGPAELLEWQPGWAALPLLPLVWSLRRAGLGEGGGLASRLARMWLRWKGPHRRHGAAACRAAIEASLNWEARLTWLFLLLEGHCHRAADELLPLLRHRDEELRQLAALGLAQLGRQILPDLKERWSSAQLAERDAICQTLWYLGPQARGCLTWLGQPDRPWSRALYYAMEQHGWPALLALGDLPLWLDEASLERLATLVFSTRKQDREQAIVALGGWGPGQAKAMTLLKFLIDDSESTIADEALRRLLQQPGKPDLQCLQRSLLHSDPGLRVESVRRLIHEHPEWHLSLGGGVSSFVHQKVVIRSLHSCDHTWLTKALRHLSKQAIPDREHAAEVLTLLDRAPLEVLSAYLSLGGPTEALVYICLEGPLEPALVIFEEWCSRGCWDHVLLCLGREELLEWFMQKVGLAKFLYDEGQHSVLTRFIEELQSLRIREDSPVADLASQALGVLELSSTDWELWPHLEVQEIQKLLLLIDWHREFPERLVTLIRAGRVFDQASLQALVRHSPEAESVLVDCLRNCPARGHSVVYELLSGFGLSAWLKLLDHWSNLETGKRELAVSLCNLSEHKVEYELLHRGPDVLPAHTPKVVRIAIAGKFLYSGAPAGPTRKAWALYLARFAESASCALHYLWRCYSEQADQLLHELLASPDPLLRYQAIVWCRLHNPEWMWVLRGLPPDPDPENRLRVLELLADKVGLSEAEWAQLDELSRINATSYGARVLLEGRGSEPRNPPGA
jgi:hypothetical protein